MLDTSRGLKSPELGSSSDDADESVTVGVGSLLLWRDLGHFLCFPVVLPSPPRDDDDFTRDAVCDGDDDDPGGILQFLSDPGRCSERLQ